MTAVVSELAHEDLAHTADWITKDDTAATDRVIDRILTDIDRLAHFPLMGHLGRIASTSEWVVVGLPYIVVYVVDERRDTLTVIGVFHVARDR